MDASESSVGQKRNKLILSPCLSIENNVVDISTDGKTLAVGCDQSVTIYDVLKLIKLHHYLCNAKIKKVAFSPNKNFLVCLVQKIESVQLFVFQIHEFKLYMRIKSDDNFSLFEYSAAFWSPKSTFLWFSGNFNLSADIIQIADKQTFLLEGTKLDSLKQPLCCFSPDEHYYIAAQRSLPLRLIIFSTYNFIRLKTIHHFEDIKDVNGVSWFPDSASFCIWDTTVQFNFQVCSLDGRLENKISSDLTEYGIKEIAHSPSGRLIAIMQIKMPLVKLYDNLTWNLVTVLTHNESTIHFNRKKNIVLDKTDLELLESENESNLFRWHALVPRKTSETLKMDDVHLQNSGPEKEILNHCHLQFSSCGQYIATYNSGFPNCIWIWNLYGYELLETIIKLNFENERKSPPDIHWHPNQLCLAINNGNDIIVWNQKSQAAYLIFHEPDVKMKSYWCNCRKLLIGVCTSSHMCFAFESVDKLNV